MFAFADCSIDPNGSVALQVLFAYAGYNPDLGYTQGMNFIVVSKCREMKSDGLGRVKPQLEICFTRLRIRMTEFANFFSQSTLLVWQAMLLGFMPEKEAFWVLVGLMDGDRFQLERSMSGLGVGTCWWVRLDGNTYFCTPFYRATVVFCTSMPLAHTWFYCMEQLLQVSDTIYANTTF